MLKRAKSIVKRSVPSQIWVILSRVKYMIRRSVSRVPIAPVGTDWVGYETLIHFIRTNKILSLEGDLVEIGTFLGGGAYVLSKFLEKAKSSKKLYVIDITGKIRLY